ncbi:MAG: hypothetical protein N2053_01550 [Chitinispirillaceae bacterium]|nr:hypothetical protein [Chitinispirillaceae bacterium]
MKNVSKDRVQSYQWHFFRSGGFDQVRIDSGRDLAELSHLDRKLWVALACPVDNVYFDKGTLALIDSDGDGRIRAEDLVSAISWTVSRLKNPDVLVASMDGLSSDEINDADNEGKTLLHTFRCALESIGRPSDDILTVIDTEKLAEVISQRKFNGDGVITEESTDDEMIRDCIREIIRTTGSKMDRSGKEGVDIELVEKFFDNLLLLDKWYSEIEGDISISPLGEHTDEAAISMEAVRKKIDEFFTLCRIAEYDRRTIEEFFDKSEGYKKLINDGMLLDTTKLEALPLSNVVVGRVIFLDKVNPLWYDKMLSFKQRIVEPLFGTTDQLTEEQWLNIKSLFKPWFDWQKRKPIVGVANLDKVSIQKILSTGKKELIIELINKDMSEKDTFTQLASLEKLVRFKRDLYSLCVNFVNFKEFYSGKKPAIFQAGTLYLDQRSCDLCIKIDDVNRHASLASMAGAYLVYCECKRGNEKMIIVAVITNGDSENIIIGRNGVFYDREGKDWDATVVKIIENPISIRQAFWLPYKNFVRMIESQVAKRAVATNEESSKKLESTAEKAVKIDKEKVTQIPKKIDIGTVAALGVAAGAVGTFVATVMGYVAGIIRLGPFAILGSLIGVIMIISGPSLVLAYIKLRKRSLGPILDASGWAINAKASINVKFGETLTKCASLPRGAKRNLFDPYAEKKSPWLKIAVLLLCLWLAWLTLEKIGMVDKWKKSRLKPILIEKMRIFK